MTYVARGVAARVPAAGAEPNIISEAAWSNFGAKKVFDNLASRIAAENPKSVIKVIAEPLRRPGQTRPFAVTYWIEKDGVRIHGQSILNRK